MMRNVVALTLLLLGAGSASAAGAENARQMFRQMDQNGDRSLQFAEIQAARARLFDRLDANHNGILDTKEIAQATRRLGEARNVEIASADGLGAQAARMDRNGDGRISRDEFARFIPDRLLRADTNGDRSLSLWELRALRGS
ncbi:EF-hand domain-containing protein [Chelatococcus asaccharovorans]|uniref:EF-hand domain-containing protein n=1 Tax=Chelatococcus asaccharovorans TaxID=28210 RepID=UPI00224C77FC|nr:EF-hand domain-containing protein [Chelatococcus asaccharovorans]CAH1651881.1 EF hand domain-containing protein [Chelatococcus asaccharovorans]CAH1686497.1 EF hand domain-containing protein [Chelatococcus asaccharovorans]